MREGKNGRREGKNECADEGVNKEEKMQSGKQKVE